MGIYLVVTYCPNCNKKIVVPKAAWYSILGVLSEKSNLRARQLREETRRSPKGVRSALRYLLGQKMITRTIRRTKLGKKRAYYAITKAGLRALNSREWK